MRNWNNDVVINIEEILSDNTDNSDLNTTKSRSGSTSSSKSNSSGFESQTSTLSTSISSIKTETTIGLNNNCDVKINIEEMLSDNTDNSDLNPTKSRSGSTSSSKSNLSGFESETSTLSTSISSTKTETTIVLNNNCDVKINIEEMLSGNSGLNNDCDVKVNNWQFVRDTFNNIEKSLKRNKNQHVILTMEYDNEKVKNSFSAS